MRRTLARRGARPEPGAASLETADVAGGDPPYVSVDDPPYISVGDPTGLVEAENEHGPYLARETELAADHVHGDWPLADVFSADPRDFALLSGDPTLAGLDPGGAVYLDTETTGLSGGAGTYVFMIGLGTFDGDRFRVWQGFLRGPDEERALLAEVARRVGGAQSIVSFFGKSFDRHRLEDKMRIASIEAPFADLRHLDLYHPFARLTKGGYPDGRLARMESELCGLERDDDLPGSLAPAAWFDYLAQRAHRLEGVFRHNLDDVLSLVTLTAHLGRSRVESRPDGRELTGPPGPRARAIARALLDAKERGPALAWLERAIERFAADGCCVRELALERAELLRRGGRLDAARNALDEIAAGDEDRFTAPALVGLAKLHEHGRKDASAALDCARRAGELVDRWHTGADRARLARDLERRVARLASRLAPDAGDPA